MIFDQFLSSQYLLEMKIDDIDYLNLFHNYICITKLFFWSIQRLQGMPANVEIGSHVWVEDPEVAWIEGIVINIEQDEVEVQTRDGKTVRDFLSS